MPDVINFRPNESKNAIIEVVTQVLKDKGVMLVVKSVSGFATYLENQTALFVEKQLNRREVKREFLAIVNYVKILPEREAQNCYSFCRRVYELPDTNAKVKFMSMVVTVFKDDQRNALRNLSSLERDGATQYFSTWNSDKQHYWTRA